MVCELRYICRYFYMNNCDTRINQINLYQKFRSVIQAAESIEEIRKSFNLKKEFKELNILLNVSSDEFKK